MKKRVLIIAGEASADRHAAGLLTTLLEREPDTLAFGVGGANLRKAGMQITVDASSLNILGIPNLFQDGPRVWKAYRTLWKQIQQTKPDVAVLLDLPDFNLHMAGRLKAKGIPVLYYISPQVWAWREYRVRKIRRRVDEMLVLFPFEHEYYQRQGVNSTFVGHPLVDEIPGNRTYRSQKEIQFAPRIALLPGSRKKEVLFHGPLLEQVAHLIRSQFPRAEFQVPVASTLQHEFVSQNLPSLRSIVRCDEEGAIASLQWADLAVVASGTAVLETALVGTPQLLFYRVSRTTAWVFDYLMGYRGFLGLPNLLHQKKVIEEYFQDKADPVTIREEVFRLIRDETYRTNMQQALKQCRGLLGCAGASARVAEHVLAVFNRPHHPETLFAPAPVLA